MTSRASYIMCFVYNFVAYVITIGNMRTKTSEGGKKAGIAHVVYICSNECLYIATYSVT